AFFLGQFRSGSDAFLRTASAAASWGSSTFTGRGHARGLLSGSKQSRFLARQRGCSDASLLFLCVSGTAWIRRGENSAECGFLRDQTARIHPALRRGAHSRKAGSSPPRLCAERLRRGVETGEVGPRRTGGEEASLAFASATFVIKRNESWLRSRATCLA